MRPNSPQPTVTQPAQLRISWPFRPIHLAYDKWPSLNQPDSAPTDGPGVLAYSFLLGLQSQISAEIELPTTISEFVGRDKVVILDAPGMMVSRHRPYELLRRYARTQDEPRRCDAFHSSVFSGLQGDVLADGHLFKVERWTALEVLHSFDSSCLSVGLSSGRPYLEYDCVHLGYRELSFPILFSGRVLGALNVRGICLESNVDRIRSLHAVFQRSHPGYFEQYAVLHPGQPPGELEGRLSVALSQFLSRKHSIRTSAAYEELIGRVSVHVGGLESVLAGLFR